jgi:hypothetical protein
MVSGVLPVKAVEWLVSLFTKLKEGSTVLTAVDLALHFNLPAPLSDFYISNVRQRTGREKRLIGALSFCLAKDALRW